MFFNQKIWLKQNALSKIVFTLNIMQHELQLIYLVLNMLKTYFINLITLCIVDNLLSPYNLYTFLLCVRTQLIVNAFSKHTTHINS